jgi:hypothetical protein
MKQKITKNFPSPFSLLTYVQKIWHVPGFEPKLLFRDFLFSGHQVATLCVLSLELWFHLQAP